ncbi:MAG TPA: serine/threonine-protein kinase [Sandaracinaceae bacterium LLY-WYZ-13_1]|nr:serine/threonine-protein kinase [Sandaracinaceae bacterium LLY-WYZ-13_1]
MIGPGDRLGPYEVLEEMARGGMATLFLGRWSGPGGFQRRVVIKLIHQDAADDPEVVRMFLDEARLSAAIQHPNVVHVEGLAEHRGEHYLVMEFIEGVTLVDILRSLIARGEQMPVDIAVSIAAEVAKGLHAAHESTDDAGRPLGIVHRDVSPQNVLVDRRGFVKIIDFGVAKAQHRLSKTATGAVKGKLAYMSPEQLAGEDIDRQTDVFALGTVLWEMLTLRRLFYRKNDLETIFAIREADVPPPGTLRPGIGPKLDDVVCTMLAQNREERFATAAAARAALLAAHVDALRLDAVHVARFVRAVAAEALEKRKPPPLPPPPSAPPASGDDDATVLEPSGVPLMGDESTILDPEAGSD